MCVILDIQPGAQIPEDQLETACDINRHGYGFAYVKEGRLFVKRKVTQKTEPEEVFKALKRLQKHRVFLHLRHATVGAVSAQNAHPFTVLAKGKTSPIDLMMMHNGTIYEYRPPAGEGDVSDTFWFNKTFLKPLSERMVGYAKQDLLKDEIFVKVVNKTLASTWSILLLFDSEGNVLRVNPERGKQYDGFWASNEYSFNTNHQRSSKTSSPYPWPEDDLFKSAPEWTPPEYKQPTSTAWQGVQPVQGPKPAVVDERAWQAWAEFNNRSQDIFEASERSKRVQSQTESRFRYEVSKVKEAVMAAKSDELKAGAPDKIEDTVRAKLLRLDRDRQTFCELTGIKDIFEVGKLTKNNFVDLCDNYPVAMAELFIDLSAELQTYRELAGVK